MSYPVLIISDRLSALGAYVRAFFEADFVDGRGDLEQRLRERAYRAVVLDTVESGKLKVELCVRLVRNEVIPGLPVIVLTSNYSLKDKLKAFEIGCDDFIDGSAPQDEVCARVTKSIFNHIAHQQLNRPANRPSFEPLLADECRLPHFQTHLQFLLNIESCTNLDELGQQFFATVKPFGWSCSLQMRAAQGVKNMEAHGMAKALESQLLFQFKTEGYFVEMGMRTIINYQRVSVLLRHHDAPSGDYSLIREHVLRLAQGLDHRILALDEQGRRQRHEQWQHRQTTELLSAVGAIKLECAEAKQKASEALQAAAQLLKSRQPTDELTAVDNERVFDQIAQALAQQMRQAEADGGKIERLLEALDAALQNGLAQSPDFTCEVVRAVTDAPTNVVKLF